MKVFLFKVKSSNGSLAHTWSMLYDEGIRIFAPTSATRQKYSLFSAAFRRACQENVAPVIRDFQHAMISAPQGLCKAQAAFRTLLEARRCETPCLLIVQVKQDLPRPTVTFLHDYGIFCT